MCRKRTYDVSNAHWMSGVEATHQSSVAADDANGHAASHRLAVNHDVGRYTEIFLRSAGSEAKTGINFVENQRHVAVAAHLAQLAEPFGVSSGGILGLARPAGQEHRIVGWRRIRMERLHWIHQHRRNFFCAPANHSEGGGINVL